MTEIWETAFQGNDTMWGLEPTASAHRARETFARAGGKDVLIPGVGYGRNAKPFLEAGMSVTGIEISATAIAIARSRLGLSFPIFHGSVHDMPYDQQTFDGIFCFGLLYLLDFAARKKLLRDCWTQLAPGGHMIFALISKKAPMYGVGARLGEDWYERFPGMPMYFYDATSIEREFAPFGPLHLSEIEEPSGGGAPLPFLYVVCRKAEDQSP